MVNITLNTKTRSCIANSEFLGYEGENAANKLVFNFLDEFIDGSAQLNIKRGAENGYVALDKVGETYELEVKSSLVSQVGEITFQLQISKADGTIYKFDTLVMTVKDAIDTDVPMPEEYPTWQEAIATALAEIENVDIYATKIDDVTTVSVTDKKGVVTEVEIHDGKDGENGKDAISPILKSEQLESGTKITITDIEGTKEVVLKDGLDGKNGVSPLVTTTQTDTGATITIVDEAGVHTATLLNGKDGKDGKDAEGLEIEIDPIYSADKPNLALKSELPTKLSELNNDVGYITGYTETDPTVPAHVKEITTSDITNWNNKSEFSGNYNDLTNKPTIPSIEGLVTSEELAQGLSTKQDVLTAGDNITIENGVISANGAGGITEIPVATADTLGGIKVGEGLEITEDGILSVLAGGGSMKILFDGEFTTSGAFSQKNLLNDSVYNYDLVILTGFQQASAGAVKIRLESTIINPTLVKEYFTGDVKNAVWSITCVNDTKWGYQLQGNFGDGTQLAINIETQSNSSNRIHGICQVVGIKFKTLDSSEITVDKVPTEGSENVITSGGVKTYVDAQVATKVDATYVNNAVSSKVDATYVTNAISGKADTSYVNSQISAVNTTLNSKADTSTVNNALASKADTSTVNTALAGKADTSHTQGASTITAGTFAGQVNANTTATATLGTAQVRNISAGTTDLTAGTSPLATGEIYFVYE